MPSILNTIRNISMRLYSSVEEIVTMCSVKKTWGHGGSHVHTLLPPDDATKIIRKKNLHLLELGSFVKINLLESSKLDL